MTGPPRPIVLDITHQITTTGFSSAGITLDFNGSTVALNSLPVSDSYLGYYRPGYGQPAWLSYSLGGDLSNGAVSGAITTTDAYSFFEADGVTPADVVLTPEPATAVLTPVAMLIGYFTIGRRNRLRRMTSQL